MCNIYLPKHTLERIGRENKNVKKSFYPAFIFVLSKWKQKKAEKYTHI